MYLRSETGETWLAIVTLAAVSFVNALGSGGRGITASLGTSRRPSRCRLTDRSVWTTTDPPLRDAPARRRHRASHDSTRVTRVTGRPRLTDGHRYGGIGGPGHGDTGSSGRLSRGLISGGVPEAGSSAG